MVEVSDPYPDSLMRVAAIISVVLAGFTSDRGWEACSFAWAIAAVLLIVWSVFAQIERLN